jgi:hypothetical protein
VESAQTDFEIDPAQTTPPPLFLAKAAKVEPIEVLAPASSAVPDRLAEIALWNRKHPGPTKNGLVRPLSIAHRLGLERDLLEDGSGSLGGGLYEKTSTGIVWGASVRVEGADRLRLRLENVRLPVTTELWVYGDGGDSMRFGRELIRPEGDLWTPSVAGETIYLELRSRSSQFSSGTIELEVSSVAETFPLDASGAPMTDGSREKGGCLEDAACYDNSDLNLLSLYKRAVAHLRYIVGGDTLLCSGALINDTDDSGFIPYLLTANHCFSTQSTASTLEAFFDYIASSCLGPAPNLSTLPRAVGSTLLATSTSTDSTFVRLSNNPAGSRAYLGWRTAPVTSGTELYRLSHPMGFSQAFSRSVAYSPPGTCATLPASRYVYSFSTLGSTAGGSSGSPMVDSDLRVRGQLLGACGPDPADPCNPLNNTVDGRFALFFPTIAAFLQPPIDVCTATSTNLCLLDERFKVEVTWENFLGEIGQGEVVPFGSPDSGLFFFFDPDNWEMLVKMTDACNSPFDSYWFFAAATTNVSYSIRVTDTQTGAFKQYFNPLGNAAAAITDTSAFSTCP